MAFIPCVVTTLSAPVLSVSMPLQVIGSGVTYAQLIQSLGSYNYGAEFFYMSATNYQQISQPISYFNFDANGNSVSAILPFAVDPYQSQPSIFYDTESSQIIFDGTSSITFNVFAGANIYFKFFATIEYLGNELDDKNSPSGDNLFEELEQREGISFFDDYCNYLIDNE